MCRTVLIEQPEEDEDSDYDSEEDEDDSDDEEEEEEEDDAGIEEITSRFLKLGYTTLDVMLTGRYKRSDPKNTKEHIQKMIHDFEDIVDEVDREEDEREAMAEEDRQPQLANAV